MVQDAYKLKTHTHTTVFHKCGDAQSARPSTRDGFDSRASTPAPDFRRMMLGFKGKSLLNKATSNRREPVPGFTMHEIAKLTHSEPPKVTEKIHKFIFKRLANKDPVVKAKVLRVIKYISLKGSKDFRMAMKQNIAPIKELQSYSCPVDPLEGKQPQLNVRKYAKEALTAIYSSGESVSSSRMQSFSNSSPQRGGAKGFGGGGGNGGGGSSSQGKFWERRARRTSLEGSAAAAAAAAARHGRLRPGAARHGAGHRRARLRREVVAPGGRTEAPRRCLGADLGGRRRAADARRTRSCPSQTTVPRRTAPTSAPSSTILWAGAACARRRTRLCCPSSANAAGRSRRTWWAAS